MVRWWVPHHSFSLGLDLQAGICSPSSGGRAAGYPVVVPKPKQEEPTDDMSEADAANGEPGAQEQPSPSRDEYQRGEPPEQSR